jgi:hypothetical protein
MASAVTETRRVPGAAEQLPGAMARPSVSLLILVAGRPEPLGELYSELADGVRGACERAEFVFVVEPMFLELAAPLLELTRSGEPIRVIQVGQRVGQTALMREGLPHCTGSIILTLPSRRRVDTAALGQLIRAVQRGADVAVATRASRNDSLLNRLQTRVFHALTARVIGSHTSMVRDVTSGVRAIRREVLDRVPLYGESARFLPLLASRDGYSVVEVPTQQHASDQRRPFPSPLTYLGTLFDLLSLFVVLRFTEKPLRFFGLVGTAALLPSVGILALVVTQRLWAGQAMADRPLFLVGVLFFVLGIQLIALGLVGEIIVHLHAGDRVTYRLRGQGE